MSIRVAILGATGFGGGELLRLLANHPSAEVVAVTSRSSAGKSVGEVHPHLASVCNQTFQADLFGVDVDCVFSSLPHGESGNAVEAVRASHPNAKVIDLSGDLRLKDLATHRKFYKSSGDFSEVRSEAVYGLTEVNKAEISDAQVIANPGCLATASILSLLPFTGYEFRSVHQHAATGSSGSGKEPKAGTHHPIRHANFLAYKVLEHQHVPEIEQCLIGAGVKLSHLPFVAHSLPISRGILCTTFLELIQALTQSEMDELMTRRYRECPFVRYRGSSPCEIENVVGSNFCDISAVVRDGQIVVHAAIDNLVKGMAGQGIQNMNVMFGLPEKAGLWLGGWRPV